MIKKFTEYLIEKETSENAIKDYVLTLKRVESDCGQDLLNISQESFVDYIKKMERKGLTLNTVKHRLYILLAFYNWAIASGHMDSNPVESIMGEIELIYATAI